MRDSAYDVLMRAAASTKTPCRDDARFITDEIPADELAPTCGTCALFAPCEAYAVEAKPSGGVWAGRRWYRGSARPRMQAGRRKTKRTDDDEPARLLAVRGRVLHRSPRLDTHAM